MKPPPTCALRCGCRRGARALLLVLLLAAVRCAARRAPSICRCCTTTSCSRRARRATRACSSSRAPRHDHRPQRRAARDLHAGGVGLGEPGGCRCHARRSAASSPGCSTWTSARLKRKLADTGARVRLPQAAAAARSWPRRSCSSACPASPCKREYRRYYPAGEVTAHLIGFTDVDDRGQEASSSRYQDWLAGKPGSRRVIKDRLGRIVEDVESIRAPQRGPRPRAVDRRKLQYLAYRELKAAVLAAPRARPAASSCSTCKTGEVLALANLPALQPEQSRHARRCGARATARSPISSSRARR